MRLGYEKKLTFMEHLSILGIMIESSFIILFDPVNSPKTTREAYWPSKAVFTRLSAVRKNTTLTQNGFRVELRDS